MSRVWGGRFYAFMVEVHLLVAASSKLSLALLIVGGGEGDGGFFGVEGDVAVSGMLLCTSCSRILFPKRRWAKEHKGRREKFITLFSRAPY